MRVALLKPDHGGTGGFERLFERLRAHLAGQGVSVETVTFDARTRPDRLYGLPVDAATRERHDEFFLHLASLERMDRLQLDDFDVVVSSQPPTFLARHPRVVALFYHQARVFYDLSEAFVASGFVDARIHAAAEAQVRRIDADRVDGVHTWLAGSDEVAGRLATYWGITEGVVAFRAAPELPTVEPVVADVADDYDPSGPAVCVSRHEWPKRTELVVQAAFADAGTTYELVGGGSRLPWLRALAERYRADPDAVCTDEPSAVWLNTGTRQLHAEPPPFDDERLRIHGQLPDAGRDDAYRRAGVVIAPAFCEDYGLTVLEAFARGRPVIVCDDGGGLVELVEGTGAGLVVPPDGAAIAAAVRSLREDADRVRAMAAAAIETARKYRHEDALGTLMGAIERATEN